jgi:hypothetical protein
MINLNRWSAMAALFAITTRISTAQVAETLNRAEKLFEQEDYYNSLPLYEELIYKGEDNVNSHLKAGMCHLFLSKPEKGLEHIKKAASPQNEVNPNYQFWLGRAYHLNMKIDSALRCYRKYLVVASQNDEFRKGVEDLIAQVHRTEIHFLHGDKAPYEVANLGENINTPFTEHSPLVSDDGKIMVFTSRRPLFANEVPEADGQYASKLYYSLLQADGKWGKALPLHPRSGHKGQFSSVQWIEKSDKILLFSADHGGSLWSSERDGDEFKDPQLVKSQVPAKFFRPDGCFSPSMDKIIFVNNSLFDGTYDLFVSEKRTEAKWGKPWKVSKLLNTTDDEIAPIWLEDGKTIVFSSKGLKGLGGYDLYKSVYDAETHTFSEPENLGYPINTPGNDTHYFEVEKGRKMYISSARASGMGSTDIYLITPNDHSASNSW